MKNSRWFLISISIVMLFYFSSCNPEGDCTIVCTCDNSGFNTNDTIELGEGYTRDECKEEAAMDDIVRCDCSGEWSRSSD